MQAGFGSADAKESVWDTRMWVTLSIEGDKITANEPGGY